MTNIENILKIYKKPENIYLALVSVTGIIFFTSMFNFSFTLSSSQWVVIYLLSGSVILLLNFMLHIPPNANHLSMDSTIYLAIIFVYNLQIALMVLLVSSLIFAFYNRYTKWWQHIANFSAYSIMLISTDYVFHLTNGVSGAVNDKNIFPYIMALSLYFFVNVLFFGVYHFILIKGNLFNVLKGIVKETITAYISSLLLSLVLSILITSYHTFGLFLFLCISVLLSIGFKQLFSLYSEVSEKAIKDQRTGLFNHGYFEDILEDELKNDQQNVLTLAILDLDNFKKYNDTFGHLKGDRLLEFFSSVIKKECQDDHIVARYGGEEFSILMKNKSEEEAFIFINNLRKKVNDSYFDGAEIFPYGCISFSAGIVAHQKGIHDKSQLIDMADQAMYYAKAQGKNMVHIYNEESVVQKNIDLEKEIHEIEQQLKIFISKDIYTFQHSKRVFRYAVEMSNLLKLSDHEKKTLVLGALFHDIGKLEVPKEILIKKGKLTPEEWDIIKKHVTWGKEIVATNDKYRELLPLIELHHERYDGKGYPKGFAAENIPKLVRILTVIDSFDAMTTERPYQKTKTFEEAFVELRRCSGTQFDPEFVEVLIQLVSRRLVSNHTK